MLFTTKMRLLAISFFFIAIAYVQSQPIDGYVLEKDVGIAYKLVYQAQNWTKAKEYCEQEGAKLAVPKSEEEFASIQKLVRHMHFPSVVNAEIKLIAWLGINNLENYKVWKNIDGQNIEDTGFHTWTGQDNGRGYSDDPAEPHCAGVDAINPGLRDWWCHRRQPYVCQKTVNPV